ncbi:hypothetical protein DRA43_00605 [Micromonospora provocatoris]|nr:hypothetical protein [Micromonospora provocatoris]RBJ11555.1 hypothetical protein DRA43_00605 [Micromonospora provocatoris]
MTETHEAALDFADVFDELVERGIPRGGHATLQACTDDLEGWASDREDSDTCAATTERASSK